MHPGSMVVGNMDYLRRPFVWNIKAGDKVLIVTDTSQDPRVWQVVMSVLSELGAEASVSLFEKRPADYYDPPESVCESMMKSTYNVLLASTGMLHAPANFRANGAPSNMPAFAQAFECKPGDAMVRSDDDQIVIW